jgi:hypothetical protein
VLIRSPQGELVVPAGLRTAAFASNIPTLVCGNSDFFEGYFGARSMNMLAGAYLARVPF